MKSETTIRRWSKQVESMEVHSKMEVYRQGAAMALKCILYDWPSPVKFIGFGAPKVGFGKRYKEKKS